MYSENIKKFNENGFIVLRSQLESPFLNFLEKYCIFDEKQNFTQHLNSLVPNAHSKYADPAMESLLLHIMPNIEKNTGIELFPTYSFYRVYRNKDDLKMHKDRNSCEISATLCLGYDYDDKKYQWPIMIEDTKISLYPGDMVIYKGIEKSHGRDEFLPPNQKNYHCQAFLHYVNKKGRYSNYKYDERKEIGIKNNNSLERKNYIQFTK